MKARLLMLLVCFFLFPGLGRADAPKSIAGITLGTNSDQIPDKLDKSSVVPLWRSEYLVKASLKPVDGYRSGYVILGNCKNKGQVARIKLSYEDESEEFYHRLHSELSKRYGKPSEWRGNPFGTLKIWKWSLKDSSNHSISIILERYEGEDDSFTPGNSIRLTDATLMKEERACFMEKGKQPAPTGSSGQSVSSSVKDFSWYLPQ